MQDFDKQFEQLKREKAALQVQSGLLDNFVTLARSAANEGVLANILQKTLKISAELTGAEKGSLFLLDENGVVTDSILTRSDTTAGQRSRIIGRVLDKGLAGWVRHHRKVGLIANTNDDDRWLDLPDQPYSVGSALAVPILQGEDLLGILTLLHARPGHFTAETADLMQLTAGQIGSALENARLYTRVEAYSRALNAEMEKGKKIQLDFLPTQLPEISGWQIAACFYPARQVSGDFYDAFMLPGDRLGIVIADVCDKGIGSALYMALFRSLIRVFSGQVSLHGLSVPGSGEKEISPSGDFLNRALDAVLLTNDYIAIEHEEQSMFATLFFGILDLQSGSLAYINGGHEPPLIIKRSGVRQKLKATGPVVGMLPQMKFAKNQTHIAAGETFIGYTDGVTEAQAPDDSLFTKQRFLSLLEKPAPSAAGLIKQIKNQLDRHMGNAPQFDDITMIAVHRLKDEA